MSLQSNNNKKTLEISCVSDCTILYDNLEIHPPYDIQFAVGEHTLEIFCDAGNIRYIKVLEQLLDRKKAIKTKNGTMFVFDVISSHANFSKHTGNFGTLMLRKDRIRI